MGMTLTERALDVLVDRTIEGGDTEGPQWNIALMIDGALEGEWIVDEPLGTVERFCERLAREVGRDYRYVVVSAVSVYVGPYVIEPSGYGPYPIWEGGR